jgi:hypothetical protein
MTVHFLACFAFLLCVLLLIKRLIFVCSASASLPLSLHIVIIVITLLIGVTAAADSGAAAASEGNDSRHVVSVLHGFKNDVVQEQLNLHHHHRDQEDESDVRGALRGFKKEEGELQKLWWQGQGNTTSTGYQHWNPKPNPNAHGAERWARKDYSMTTMALMQVALESKAAAIAANEAAAAASRAANETDAAAKARNFADLRTAVEKLLDDATAAEAASCVAFEMLKIANEEDDEDESTSSLIQNVAAVPGIAEEIAKQATQTAHFAERAVEAINQQPMPNDNEVISSTVHTKVQAKATLKMVEDLVTLMISNARGSAPGQDVSLIDTAP